MVRLRVFLVGLAGAVIAAGPATAQPITIPVTGGIFDMVYDDSRGILYMTTGGPEVLRYRLSSRHFLKPLEIFGNLQGIDISADNNRLAVADLNSGPDKVWIDDYDLVAGKNTRISGPAGSSTGTLDVAYHADGLVAVTGALPQGYSGWSSMHVANPHDGTMVPIGATITNSSVVHASSDHKAIGFTEGDISDGPWGTVQPSKLKYTTLQETGWFTYDIAIAPRGAYFAVPTYDGTFVADHAGNGIALLGTYARTWFNGVVFDPIHDHLLYQSLAEGSEIQGWDIFTQKIIRVYKTGVYVDDSGNGLFPIGMLRISPDGKILFMKTGTGAIALDITP